MKVQYTGNRHRGQMRSEYFKVVNEVRKGETGSNIGVHLVVERYYY